MNHPEKGARKGDQASEGALQRPLAWGQVAQTAR